MCGDAQRAVRSGREASLSSNGVVRKAAADHPASPMSSAAWSGACPDAASGRSLGGEQAIRFAFDYGVALADPIFQAWPVEHHDVPAIVLNQSDRLQLDGRLCDALAAHSQHVRY